MLTFAARIVISIRPLRNAAHKEKRACRARARLEDEMG